MTKDGLTLYTTYRGRVALSVLLRSLQVQRGEEIALQAFTCAALPEAILSVGAIPLYIDTREKTLTMDAEDLERKISSRTKAIIVQHTFGIPADMRALTGIAARYGIPLIEDCCSSIFSTFDGKRVGDFGLASFYSFELGKPIALGIGGAITTKDEVLSRKVSKVLENFYQPSTSFRIELQYQAFRYLSKPSAYWPIRSLFHWGAKFNFFRGNYFVPSREYQWCMDPLVSRRLQRNLSNNLDREVQRDAVIDSVRELLPQSLVDTPSGTVTSYTRFPIFVKDKARALRLARKLRVALSDVYASVIHPLNKGDLKKMFYENGSCPRAEFLSDTIVSFPVYEKYSLGYLRRVNAYCKVLSTI